MPLNVAVFCGANKGKHPAFEQAATEIGTFIGRENHTLLFGGYADGLMGILAQAAHLTGAKIWNVIPPHHHEYHVFSPCDKTIEVKNVSMRKEILIEQADIFIALSGGFGTLDEIYTLLAHNQWEGIYKPLLLINTQNYWQPLIDMHKQMLEQGFIKQKSFDTIHIANTKDDISKFFQMNHHISHR